jgi:hypothetical protein
MEAVKNPRTILVLSVGILLAAGPLASANLIVNGGFEIGNFSGWSVTLGSDPVVGVASLAAHDGSYGAYFGSFYSIDSISQTYATVPGTLYQLSFWLRTDASRPPSELTLNGFQANFGGTTVFTNYPGPYSAFPYTQFTFSELASTDLTTLTFNGWEKTDYSFVHLDDVSVTAIVPEPGSALLLGLSLASLFLLSAKRRNRRKNADLGKKSSLSHVSIFRLNSRFNFRCRERLP